MNQALAGLRVIVPVTEGRRDLAAAVAAAGATAIEVEFIAIAPTTDPGVLGAAVRQWCAGEYDWMAVTSRNAVLAMDALARSLGLSLAAPASVVTGPASVVTAQVAAVGDATRSVCESIGVRVHLVPATANAKGLVADFPQGEGRVLVPVGDNASGALAAGLARKGWQVTTVEAYRTVEGEGPTAAHAEALASGAVDAVLLTSGAVATRLAAACPKISESTTMVAIGPTTAAAAAHAGLSVAAVAEAPTYESLIAALSRSTGRTMP